MTQRDSKDDVRELITSASPEQLYAAWAEPEHIARWFADRARGRAREGESMIHVFDDFGLEVRMDVVEAVPGERLIFSGVAPGGLPFRQRIDIARRGGQSALTLTHSGFDMASDGAFDEEYKGMDSGWTMALALLRHYLERYWGRDRQSLLVMRPASFDWDTLDDLFRRRRGDWLQRDGAPVEGMVLADSGREVCLAWDAIDGAIELKAFCMGPQRVLALRTSSWATTPPDADALARWMADRLEHLAASLA